MTTNESRKDVYGIVTENIIKVMESGIVPWRMPWGVGGQPRNAITQKPYRGVNVPLLAMYAFDTNVFLSEKQLENLGGTAKEGEYPIMATYWEWRTDSEDAEKQYSVLLYEKVFNVSQVEGVSFDGLDPLVYPENPLEYCRDLVKGIVDDSAQTLSIMHSADCLLYDMDTDVIFIPPSESYRSPELFYYDLFQMFVHATGITTRLDRKEFALMGEGFSKEDLIADMGAHYLCFHAGITGNLSLITVAHLHKWIELFGEDTKLFVSACTMAQKAVDFILNGYQKREENFADTNSDATQNSSE
jgi:antirestriction protein ArdC